MAAGKPVDLKAPAGAIEREINSGNYAAARKQMAVKLARMLDSTDSARDAKSICLSLNQLVDRLEVDALNSEAASETPYAQIMREAEAALINA